MTQERKRNTQVIRAVSSDDLYNEMSAIELVLPHLPRLFTCLRPIPQAMKLLLPGSGLQHQYFPTSLPLLEGKSH